MDAIPSINDPEESAAQQPAGETKSPIVHKRVVRVVRRRMRIHPDRVIAMFMLAVIMFAIGLGSGYAIWGHAEMSNHTEASMDMQSMAQEMYPKDGYDLQVKYQDAGPKLLEAGAINLENFKQVYQQSGDPLSQADVKILTTGGPETVHITQQNAHFLLNFFWAFGLANRNRILDLGPIQQQSQGNIEGFASTGGWTLAKKPVKGLFSSSAIVTLTDEQQSRLEDVARAVYRPCCNNATNFPDCNHGMAMLGLLELMASQNATTEQMFAAAKSANAYWYPQQTLEQAIYFKILKGQEYTKVDPRVILSEQYSSISGFQTIHQVLAQQRLLNQSPNGGNNCGV